MGTPKKLRKQHTNSWLTSKATDNEFLIYRCQIKTEKRIFIIGLHRVFSGYQLIGIYKGSDECSFRWNCGRDPDLIFSTQTLLRFLILRGVSPEDIPFDSVDKPWKDDLNFVSKVRTIMKGRNIRLPVAFRQNPASEVLINLLT